MPYSFWKLTSKYEYSLLTLIIDLINMQQIHSIDPHFTQFLISHGIHN